MTAFKKECTKPALGAITSWVCRALTLLKLGRPCVRRGSPGAVELGQSWSVLNWCEARPKLRQGDFSWEKSNRGTWIAERQGQSVAAVCYHDNHYSDNLYKVRRVKNPLLLLSNHWAASHRSHIQFTISPANVIGTSYPALNTLTSRLAPPNTARASGSNSSEKTALSVFPSTMRTFPVRSPRRAAAWANTASSAVTAAL